ncbi:hypothetical protein E4U41_004500 [Claviceps citrina]|nr:hypothetical protein E4U41_004500 [Claviceps citrina]
MLAGNAEWEVVPAKSAADGTEPKRIQAWNWQMQCAKEERRRAESSGCKEEGGVEEVGGDGTADAEAEQREEEDRSRTVSRRVGICRL